MWGVVMVSDPTIKSLRSVRAFSLVRPMTAILRVWLWGWGGRGRRGVGKKERERERERATDVQMHIPTTTCT